MKTVFITTLLFGSMIYLTSCQDESRIKEMENRLSELETIVNKFDLIVQEQDSIKKEKEAELKQFEDIIVDVFNDEIGSIEFQHTDYIGECNISISDDMNEDLINKGYVSRMQFLYTSMFNYDVYEWELTSKGRNNLFKVEKEWNKNIRDYEERWFFIYGSSKFIGVTKVEYINSNQAKVTYETICLSITDIADEDWYVGEVSEHELDFKKDGLNWKISNSEPLNSTWVR